MAHNAIWLLKMGEDPATRYPLTVDHKDRDGSNNRLSNLRLATSSQQLHNRGKILRGGKHQTGYKFVSWDRSAGKWRARYQDPALKKEVHVGTFIDDHEAHCAALAHRHMSCWHW